MEVQYKNAIRCNVSEHVKILVSMFLGPNKGGPLSKIYNWELIIRATDSIGKLR
jgi:hypothetical protein